MNQFERFNSIFPNSSYKEVHNAYIADDKEFKPELYQAAKAPISDKVFDFTSINSTNKRVGWIISSGYVVIDVDNNKTADIIINIIKAKKTKCCYFRSKNGCHFIFRENPKLKIVQQSGKYTALGIKIDTRVSGYIILPYNDPEREWTCFVDNEFDQVPFFLFPLSKFVMKKTDNVFDWNENDTNSKLFTHFLNLKDYAGEITKPQVIEIIRMMNEFVLSSPLSEHDLISTVLRKELIERDNINEVTEKRVTLENLADKIIKEELLITNEYGEIYKYNGKFYERVNDTNLLEHIIHTKYDSKLLKRERVEIINFIMVKKLVLSKEFNKNPLEIICENGIIDIKDMTIRPHTPYDYSTMYIPHNFNTDVPFSNRMSSFIDHCSNNRADERKLILEMIGYCFLRTCMFQKFFLVVGKGQNGKSTLLDIIEEMIGYKNKSAVKFSQMNNAFEAVKIKGKLINLGDESEEKNFTLTENLKAFTSGSECQLGDKHEKSTPFKNFATLIFAMNNLPPINDKSAGFYRRVQIISMDTKIEKPVLMFKETLTEQDYEWLFKESIFAVKEALERGAMTTTAISTNLTEYYRVSQSSVLLFCDEVYVDPKTQIHGKPIKQVYQEYVDYCLEAGYLKVSRENFVREVTNNYDLYKMNTTYDGDASKWRFLDSKRK